MRGSQLGRVTGDTGFVRRTGADVLKQLQADANRSRLLADAEKKVAAREVLLEQKETAVDKVISNLETTGQPGGFTTASIFSGATPVLLAAAVVGFLILRK